MKAKKKTYKVEYWDCGRHAHHHRTEEVARRCMKIKRNTKPLLSKEERATRNKAIYQIRQHGKTYRAIGEMFDLHPGHIRSIIVWIDLLSKTPREKAIEKKQLMVNKLAMYKMRQDGFTFEEIGKKYGQRPRIASSMCFDTGCWIDSKQGIERLLSDIEKGSVETDDLRKFVGAVNNDYGIVSFIAVNIQDQAEYGGHTPVEAVQYAYESVNNHLAGL